MEVLRGTAPSGAPRPDPDGVRDPPPADRRGDANPGAMSVSPGALTRAGPARPLAGACDDRVLSVTLGAPQNERLLRCTAKLAGATDACRPCGGPPREARVGAGPAGGDDSGAGAVSGLCRACGPPGEGAGAGSGESLREGTEERAGLVRCSRTRLDRAESFSCWARSCAACCRIVVCSCVLCSMSCAVVGLRGSGCVKPSDGSGHCTTHGGGPLQ